MPTGPYTGGGVKAVQRPPARQAVEVDGRRLVLSNLDKPLWPADGYTKADLINYLLAVAPCLLPHLRGRPLVLTRYPHGVQAPSFYQKNTPSTAPAWLRTWEDTGGGSGRPIRYLLVEERAALAWLGNLAAIELHPWYSRADTPDQPDVAVVDLDPAEGTDFDDAREVALLLKRLLDDLGLVSHLKTSGATGLHLYLPIAPGHTYPQVVAFTRRLAELIVQVCPRKTTVTRAVSDRTGRVYLDYLQNGRGKTLAGVYCPRPLPGAPVSTPLGWDELGRVQPRDFNLATVPRRLGSLGDLFHPVLGGRQSLAGPAAELGINLAEYGKLMPGR